MNRKPPIHATRKPRTAAFHPCPTRQEIAARNHPTTGIETDTEPHEPPQKSTPVHVREPDRPPQDTAA